jgi:multidrug efflux system membrane fusion protein
MLNVKTLFASRSRIAITATLGLAALGLAVFLLQRTPRPAGAAVRPPSAEVEVTPVQRTSLPIFASGLGTVQASRTVALHSQVDGKLQDVSFTEGQHVAQGDALAKIDPRLFQASLDQAKAKRAQDQANLTAAQKDLERYKQLALKSFETQQNLDLQQAKVDQNTAMVAADDAMIESAETQLDYTTIRAPFAGRIGVRQVDPGNIIKTTDQTPLAILTQTQPAAVMFTLPAQYLDNVRDALKAGKVEVLAFDRDNRKQLAKGTLLLIDNVIDQTTATIRLKATFPNEDDALWPGEFVNARILIETRNNVLAIPTESIQRGPDGVFAWTVGSDNKVADHKIALGPSSGDLTVVDSGVNEGDRVVTDGFFKLRRDATVTVKTAKDAAKPGTAQ